ncbi:MAG: acetyltransferase [Bacteroidales bacterium]
MNLYGASGHAKVIIDIASQLSIEIEGIIDDNGEINELSGYPVYLPSKYIPSELADDKWIISIGDNYTRKKVYEKKMLNYHEALIHPTAVITPHSELLEGTVVMANVTINVDVEIGRHCIINTACVIDHDSKIFDFVHVSPNASITGGVHIGEGTHVGTGATILPGVKIGKWAIIGAGSVILRDVKDYDVVVGNPGKILRQNPIKYD